MLEGTDVNVPQGGRRASEQKLVKVRAENILFICGGAFDGIDKLIANAEFSGDRVQNGRRDDYG